MKIDPYNFELYRFKFDACICMYAIMHNV